MFLTNFLNYFCTICMYLFYKCCTYSRYNQEQIFDQILIFLTLIPHWSFFEKSAFARNFRSQIPTVQRHFIFDFSQQRGPLDLEARRPFTSACRSFAKTTKNTTLDFVFLAVGHRSALTYAGLRTLFHRTVDTFRLHPHFLPLSLPLFLIARFLATSSGIIFIYLFIFHL